MPRKQHDRQYDLVVFGATGYTGKLATEHVATHLPVDLKWAVAGRSREKLEQVVAKCEALNPDRRQPDIEICAVDAAALAALARKTFVLITTVGPYGTHGEHAFRACAEAGTHYLDVTGEVPFVCRMILRYGAAACDSGAIMIPHLGIESVPSDLLTWLVAGVVRARLDARTGDVVVSMHKLKGSSSGGTTATIFSVLDNFTVPEIREAREPYALSPLPAPSPRRRRKTGPARRLLQALTGLVHDRVLGLQTTALPAIIDGPIVQRTWGLLQTVPGLRRHAYGPHFAWRMQFKAQSWLHGALVHLVMLLVVAVVSVAPLRWLVRRYLLPYAPGEGAAPEVAARDQIEYRAVAEPDFEEGGDLGGGQQGQEEKVGYGRFWYDGPLYYLTGIFATEAAMVLLEDEHVLPGGIYTPACLGQPFVDRLESAGVHTEVKILTL